MWNLLPPELSSLAIIHPFTEPVLCASRTSGGTVRHRILLEQLARNRQACERAIKEEDQPEEGNFRIPTCASIRVRGRKVMARERLHRAPCPLVRKVTRGGTDLPSLFLSLSLSSSRFARATDLRVYRKSIFISGHVVSIGTRSNIHLSSDCVAPRLDV